MPILSKDVRRFTSKFIQKGEDECWNWTGNITGGYGQFKYSGKAIPAHRFAYRVYRGEIPEGLWVLHDCDNPICVNPNHLFLGTAQDNTNDMVSKGRARFNCSEGPGEKACKGEEHGMARLSEDQVKEIRRRYKRISYHSTNARQLAVEFGVTQNQITRIVKGERWNHVE